MKTMRFLVPAFLVLLLALTGCTGQTETDTGTDQPTEIVVFAAASLTETLEQIADKYEEAAPGVKIIFNFDSSGTLKTQIEEGADCDIYISAAQKQMDMLDGSVGTKGGNTEGLDLVLPGTRTDLLENTVVLVVSDENSPITSFDDLAAALKKGSAVLALGNEDVPVGQYARKILSFYGLEENDLAKKGLITYCSNVKEVTTQVSEAVADAGIIYLTDAFSAGLRPIDTAEEKICGKVVYPAAVMKNSENQTAAKAFLNYLKGEDAGRVFKSTGFKLI